MRRLSRSTILSGVASGCTGRRGTPRWQESPQGGLDQIPEPPLEHIICGADLVIDGNPKKVLLEEFEFTVTQGNVSPIATALGHAIADAGT